VQIDLDGVIGASMLGAFRITLADEGRTMWLEDLPMPPPSPPPAAEPQAAPAAAPAAPPKAKPKAPRAKKGDVKAK
jgi:hypothetical protein